jgi:hypothetical protein
MHCNSISASQETHFIPLTKTTLSIMYSEMIHLYYMYHPLIGLINGLGRKISEVYRGADKSLA